MLVEEKRLSVLLALTSLVKAVEIASEDMLVVMARELALATARILEQV